MATLQRQLVNLTMLIDDIELLPDSDLGGGEHSKLLAEYKIVLDEIQSVSRELTEKAFLELVRTSQLDAILPNKKMIVVQIKMIDSIVAMIKAEEKVALILSDEFDEGADTRLSLLQTKAIKARAELKEMAKVMGESRFSTLAKVLGIRSLI